MRVAVIDIGTNSTRLLVADIINKEIVVVFRNLQSTRIGEKSEEDCEIKDNIIKRTIDCLLDYQAKCLELGVQEIRVIATSAIREASNSKEVVEKIQMATGLNVELISGEREAYLSYLGASSEEKKTPDNSLLVVDIGGGSTEVVYMNNNNLICRSVPVGAVRLAQTKELGNIKNLLRPLLAGLPSSFEVIGVGGTITSLAAIKQELKEYDPLLIQGYVLKFSNVKQLSCELNKMSLEQRKKLRGLQPQRADIIPFGTFILKEMMELLEIKDIKVSEKDLMHGLIYEAFFLPI